MENQKMYVVTTAEQLKSITGCDCSEQDFRKSVIISGVLGYDKCSGDLRKGYMIFPISEDVPIESSGNSSLSVRLNDDQVLWHFVVTEESFDGESKT